MSKNESRQASKSGGSDHRLKTERWFRPPLAPPNLGGESEIEVTEGEDIVGAEALATGLIDVVGLPGANMDLWGIRVAEVPHHEHIAFVAIARRVPLLMDSHAIDTFDGGMLYHHHVVELHLDITVRLESTTQVREILLFGLRGVDHPVA